MRGDGLFLTMIFVGIPWVLGWIGKTSWAHQRQMKALELRAETNSRLLDRFGSDPSFLEFLKSGGQFGLLDVPTVDSGRSQTYMRMLTALQIGLVLFAGGVACGWAHGWARPYDQFGFAFFGALGVGLGLGSILSAVAAFVVGKFWTRLHADDPAAAQRQHA
jgi:hypothetical protein